jgi:hypothetical protein
MSEKIDNVDSNWFRAKIDKRDLKNLSKKSDLKGFQHIILYFLLLFFFGYMAVTTWGNMVDTSMAMVIRHSLCS